MKKRLAKNGIVCLMVIVATIFFSATCFAKKKINFEAIGFYYVTPDGEASFLEWTRNSISDSGSSKNYEGWVEAVWDNRFYVLPDDTKFYAYGLDINTHLPPHLLGYQFAYLDEKGEMHGNWPARFIPVQGYEEKVYEIRFGGPYEKLKNAPRRSYMALLFIVPKGGPGGLDAYLFRFHHDGS